MRVIPPLLAALTAVLYATTGLMAAATGTEDLLAGATWGGAALTISVVGAIIAMRQPRNKIGWLLLASGLLETTAGWASVYGEYARLREGGLPGAVPLEWVGSSAWAFSSTILLIFLPLYFPTGSPPSRRWRWIGWVGALAAALLMSSTIYIAAFEPDLMALEWDVAEAVATERGAGAVLALSELGFPLLMGASVLALLSLVVRFVRSRGVERQQLKLLVFGATFTISFVIALDTVEVPQVVEAVGTAVAMPAIGIAVMAAVLRYRLFEIDRVISRTVSYALVTLLLVGVYLTAVTVLTLVTQQIAGGSPVTVAAATLLAAAAFRPARRRIQDAVDRRFDRRRYDAQMTLSSYRLTLRDQVDLDAVSSGLVAAASAAVHPVTAMLWLREAR